MFDIIKKTRTRSNDDIEAIEFEVCDPMFSGHTKLSFFCLGDSKIAMHRSSKATVWHEINDYQWINFMIDLFDDVRILHRSNEWFREYDEYIHDDCSYSLCITFHNGQQKKFDMAGTCSRGVDIFRQLVGKHFDIDVFYPKEKEKKREFIPNSWLDLEKIHGVEHDWSFLDSEPYKVTLSTKTNEGESWCVIDLQADETFFETKRVRREIFVSGKMDTHYINGYCEKLERNYTYDQPTRVYRGAVVLEHVWEFLNYILNKFDFRMLNEAAFQRHPHANVMPFEDGFVVTIEVEYANGHKDKFEMESGSVAENFLKCCMEKSTILWMVNF